MPHRRTQTPKHTHSYTLITTQLSFTHIINEVMAAGDGAILSSPLGPSMVCINKQQIEAQINGYEFHVRLGLVSLWILL